MHPPLQLGQKPARDPAIDAVRGFALCGILLVNATWFSGTAVLGPADRAALVVAAPAVDATVRTVVHVSVEAAFYSLFALLFGAGLGLHLRGTGPGQAVVLSRFRRRAVVLFVVGFLHASLLWFGDIVSLYAVTALALPFLVPLPTRALLCVGLGLVTAGPALSVALLTTPDPGEVQHGPMQLLPVFGAGGLAETLHANFAFLRERWWLAVESGRFPRLLGLFAIGLALTRFDLTRGLRRVHAAAGAVLVVGGLAGRTLLAPSEPALAAALDGASALLLALGYGALALQVARRWIQAPNASRVVRALAAAGRMSFSLYVLQSVVGIAVFYGVGAGLWATLGETAVLGLIAAYWVVQCWLALAWQRILGRGPLEAIVARLTPASRRARPVAADCDPPVHSAGPRTPAV